MCVYMYRLSYERRGDISFIAGETISYFNIDDIKIYYRNESDETDITESRI